MRKKIFISYSSEDYELVEVLKSKLKKSKYFKPIIVEENREPMSYVPSKTENYLKECEIIIPILTQKSMHAQWINQEIGYSKALNTIDIIPIVQKNIIDDLRGFINKQVDLSYSFELGEKNYSKTIDNLLSYLNRKYKPPVKNKKVIIPSEDNKSYDFGPFALVGWSHLDKEVNIDFKVGLNFDFQIDRLDEEQDFHIYYKLSFERGGSHWIGFKPKLPDFTDQYENTKAYPFKGFSISYKELILFTLNDRQLTNLGKPISIQIVRMRASNVIHSPVKFSFSFTQN